ncbi:hypothetical protein N7F80_004441 [Escherichia coli]|nr:hypothetical protein [Escherichia coli]
MMEIFWTMLASQDRKRIREYIAEQNLMVAIELDERTGLRRFYICTTCNLIHT